MGSEIEVGRGDGYVALKYGNRLLNENENFTFMFIEMLMNFSARSFFDL